MLDPSKKDVKRFENLGVICRDTSSPRASLAFIIPKAMIQLVVCVIYAV